MPGTRCRPAGRAVRGLVAPFLAVLLTGVPAGTLTACGSPSTPERTAAASSAAGLPAGDAALPAGVTAVLDRRAAAALRRDRQAWLATLDPADAAFVGRQRRLADDLATLPVTAWRYRPGTVLAGGGDRLELHVTLAYRLAGDTRDIERDQVLTLTRSAAGWRVAGLRGGLPEPADLWDLGPVETRRGSRALVVAAAGRARRLPDLPGDLDAAAAAVDRAWGTAWPRTVIALVPADRAGMAALLGPGHDGGLDRLAAVTTGDVDVHPAGGGPRPTADRVVLNPDAFAGFGPVARQVVLTHEVTHLATRAAGLGPVPLWLEEGFADYVAYRDTGLDRAIVAGDLVTEAKAGRAPRTLPDAEAFDPAHGPVEASYAAAWLAVDLVAQEAGPQGPARFYRVAAASGLPAAFRQVLGTDRTGFEARWRAAIRSLAGSPG